MLEVGYITHLILGIYSPITLILKLVSKKSSIKYNNLNEGKAININIKPGIKVMVVQKEDQRTGKLTEGIVKDILTNSQMHPHGIKVRLENNIVGRVQKIL